jgi:hypothetical protein
MWACGFAASSKLPENVRIVARKLFEDSIGCATELRSPRAKAYCLLGVFDYLQANEGRSDLVAVVHALTDSLLSGLQAHSDKEWWWYEAYLTYGNAILPLGMLAGAMITEHKHHRDAALSTLRFLTDTLVLDRRLEVIGNDGWYLRGGNRAWYDQQSIDAGYTVYLYAKAYEWLADKEHLELAQIAHSWFYGNNRSGVWVYDPETCGCFDAIAPWGLNLNQGAESCICMLLAQLAMQRIESTDTASGESVAPAKEDPPQ